MKFQYNKILFPLAQANLSRTGRDYFPPMILDYLNGEEKLKPFYKYPVSNKQNLTYSERSRTINAFKSAIFERQNQKINRKLLVEILKEQYSSIVSRPQSLIPHIELLLLQNTFTITTGHQLCLFTGPLYFIYKIITTINLAEKLKNAFPEYNFIPVYWMVSEDHDFNEINHIHLFNKTIEWKPDKKEREGAVGRISADSIKNVLEELKSILGQGQYSKELYEFFKKTYSEHKTLAQATRYLVNELFGKYGLVIIDGDDKRLKSEFKDVIEDDIINNMAFQLINSTNKKLSRHYKVQVNPRGINCFYLGKNSRERIEKNLKSKGSVTVPHQEDLKSYSVLNTDISFSEAELLTEIHDHPEKFSPNVVLRPLYQEKILPNLAYVGGSAELAYWLQLKSAFDHYDVNFPVLILRNSVLLIDNKINKRLNKLGIQPKQLFNNTNLIVKNFLRKTSQVEINIDAEKKIITKAFKSMILKAEKTDVSLKAAVSAELQKQLKSLSNIERKLLKAEKRKRETDVDQINKIKEKLFPKNTLQERYDNFIPYYLKYGKEFFSILKRELNPLEYEFIILTI
ncbi:MAG: bacillithiol biosynthesis cysteine-adding enzyme BshC [Bacteroidota bacterium]